jgi:MFS family permease
MIRAGFLSLRAAIARPTSADHHCPAARRKYVLAAAILASSLGFIDGSVVAIAIPAIRSALGATFGQAQWIHNAYVLLLSALILVGGAAGDRFGQRDVFAAGVVVIVLASLWCGLAATPAMLIAARIVQGLGAAFMVPGSLALIARNYPAEIRGRAIGLWAALSGIAAALGPVAGGAILTLAGEAAWRWLFLINLPLGAAALVLIFARVPRDRPVNAGALDWAGAVLVTLALGLMAYGLTAAGAGGNGGPGIFAGFGGAAILVAFLV